MKKVKIGDKAMLKQYTKVFDTGKKRRMLAPYRYTERWGTVMDMTTQSVLVSFPDRVHLIRARKGDIRLGG